MSNPPLLLCDADALIQILVSRFLQPLKCLRSKFGVQPAVVQEVDVELRSHRRHQFVPTEFAKAVTKGLVVVLTLEELRARSRSLDAIAAKSGPDALWAAAHDRAGEYELRVDRGEAHTFAMAVELRVPAVSNDGSSLRVMRENGLKAPHPVLRSFDLYALAVQTGEMPEADADKARGRLVQARENIPQAFRNCSFSAGLPAFEPRVVDATVATSFRARSSLALRPLPSPKSDGTRPMPETSPSDALTNAPPRAEGGDVEPASPGDTPHDASGNR